MSNIFNLENPFWSFLSKLVDGFWLMILWYLNLIPAYIGYKVMGGSDGLMNILQGGNAVALIVYLAVMLVLTFTLGPATTAFFYVAQKMVVDQEGNITKQFFHSYKENFRQASILWLIMLGVGAVLFFNLWFYRMASQGVNQKLGIFVFFILVILWVYLMTLQFIFPVQSKFANPIKNTIKFSLVLSLQKFGWTLVMMIVFAAVISIGLFVMVPVLLFAPGIITFIDARIVQHIFEPYIQQIQENPDQSVTMAEVEARVKEEKRAAKEAEKAEKEEK